MHFSGIISLAKSFLETATSASSAFVRCNQWECSTTRCGGLPPKILSTWQRAHESSDLLRRPGNAAARGRRGHSQADGTNRQPTDPLAPDEVLCPLRVHRLHSLPGIS